MRAEARGRKNDVVRRRTDPRHVTDIADTAGVESQYFRPPKQDLAFIRLKKSWLRDSLFVETK